MAKKFMFRVICRDRLLLIKEEFCTYSGRLGVLFIKSDSVISLTLGGILKKKGCYQSLIAAF